MDAEQNEPLTPVNVRELSGLTQSKMGALLGKRQGDVSDWDRQKKVPRLTPSQWLLLLSATGCTPKQLVEAYEPEQVDMIPIRLQAVGITYEES